jgi:hypothetical protein
MENKKIATQYIEDYTGADWKKYLTCTAASSQCKKANLAFASATKPDDQLSYAYYLCHEYCKPVKFPVDQIYKNNIQVKDICFATVVPSSADFYQHTVR